MSTPGTTARVLACLALAAVLSPAAAAGAAGAAGATAALRERSGLQLTGNGYGHGHGLSQYGAQGAASQGKSYKGILHFYYPGLARGRATGTVKVLISADTSTDVVVRARDGLRVKSIGSGHTHRLTTEGVSLWRLLPADQGRRTALAAKTRGTWRTTTTLAGEAEFSAGGAPVTLHTPNGDLAYRGALRSAAPDPRKSARDTVNVLALDTYLRGVVPREVPAAWKQAAVQAQAVAARTYAAFERRSPMARHYQICDTSLCQVYGGASAEYDSTNAAVHSTSGQILTRHGDPAFTQFSASNGGWMSAGSQPYLVAKKDPYDHAYRGWTDTVTARELEHAYPGAGPFRSATVTQRDGHGQWGGRVVKIRLTFARGTSELTGEAFRSNFGLRSSWFIVN